MIDDRNSTDDPLAIDAVFEGATTDVNDTTALAIMVDTDQDGTLFIECSPDDGATWPISKATAVLADVPDTISEELSGRNYRVRYVNGGVEQTRFNLVTNSHWTRAASNLDTADGMMPTKLGPSTNLDAFSRLRTSQPELLFDSKFTRNRKEVLAWSEVLTGGGTSTHDGDRSSVLLAVTSSGDKVERQSKSRIVYLPGNSLLAVFTAIAPVEDDNVRWRQGYFDSNDGIFLQGVGSTISWVIRSSTSGSPVDTVVAQADWNNDGFDTALNPLNPSGRTMDFSNKGILAWIDLQWLSLGRVRVGFDLEGVFDTAHEFNHSNVTSVAYMASPNLPMRYEIEATDTPGAVRTLEMICTSVINEGSSDPVGLSTSFSNQQAGVAVDDTYKEVLAVRVKAADADRVRQKLHSLSILNSTSGNMHWVLVVNPASMGAGAWVSAGAESSLEFNVTRGTGWVRGSEDHIVDEGYFSADINSIQPEILNRLRLGRDLDGTVDIMSLQMANASAATTETIFAAMHVDELF